MTSKINFSLIGIIACGGHSTRMKSDKSLLNYHGKPQRYFLYDLLRPFCNDVFLSCNKSQAPEIDSGYQYIADEEEYSGHGPISGLLSAFKNHRGKSILFIGCDYPYLNSKSIHQLTENRNPDAFATCFINDENIAEPLISVYENSCFEKLSEQFKKGEFSLKYFLENNQTMRLTPEDKNVTRSVDTVEDAIVVGLLKIV